MKLDQKAKNNPELLCFSFASRRDGSARYRLYQYVPFLENSGYRIRILEPEKRNKRGLLNFLNSFQERRKLLRAARETDILFIQRRLFPKGFLRRLQSLQKKILFDFDDAIFTCPKGNWSAVTRWKVRGRIKTTLEVSQAVLAGNSYLKACAENLGGKNVSWLPTAVDTQRYPIKSHGPKDSLVLGWIGSSSNHPYLEKLSGVLPQLAQEFPNLKILVISDQNFQMEGIPVEYRPWSETTEIKDILEMDVGLMPLTEDPWTLGKCALKAIQYMAAGIPAVCSDVGANREVIENGVDGFLVKRDAEWIRILRELLRSPEKRSAVGFAARKKVEENFDIKKTFKILLHALESFS